MCVSLRTVRYHNIRKHVIFQQFGPQSVTPRRIDVDGHVISRAALARTAQSLDDGSTVARVVGDTGGANGRSALFDSDDDDDLYIGSATNGTAESGDDDGGDSDSVDLNEEIASDDGADEDDPERLQHPLYNVCVLAYLRSLFARLDLFSLAREIAPEPVMSARVLASGDGSGFLAALSRYLTVHERSVLGMAAAVSRQPGVGAGGITIC